MSLEPASIRMLREVLEQVLPPAKAAAVLFEGLSSWGDRVPVGPDEVAAVVHGPMRSALARWLPEAAVEDAMRRITEALTTAEAPTDVHGALAPRGDGVDEPHGIDVDLGDLEDEDVPTTEFPSRWRAERSTRDLPGSGGHPVAVLVLAGSESFASRLRLVLGVDRVAPRTARDLWDMAGVMPSASIVVVDATDVPAAEADAVGRALAEAPSGCVAALWGAELPFGRRVAEHAGPALVAIARRDGIEPLFDLVRSRS